MNESLERHNLPKFIQEEISKLNRPISIKEIESIGIGIPGTVSNGSIIKAENLGIRNLEIDDKQFVYIEAIVKSMTDEERKNPDLVAKSSSRRERITRGSGRPYVEVNNLIKRFDEMKKSFKMLSGMSEDDIKSGKFQQQMQNQQKAKKGKGKGRGNFRI